MANIAVLGLGAMGSRMARNLMAAGHDLTVWNRSPERAERLVRDGATYAATPREAVSRAAFVIAVLRDDHASRSVWLDCGALQGMAGGAVAIESSTLSLVWTRELAAQCAVAGVAFLDAPVAGSRPQAEARTLVHLVGGEAATAERAQAVFAAMGAAAHHCGPAGSGAVLKLAINMMLGVQVACVAEALALMTRNGLDPGEGFSRLAGMPVCSPAARTAGESMLAGRFAPQFPVELVVKDFGYILAALGGHQGAPVSSAVYRLFEQAEQSGLGAQHLTAVASLYGDVR